jgi:DNA processing protein
MDTSRSAGLTETDWLCLSFLSGIGPSRLSRLYTYLDNLQTPECEINHQETESLKDTDSQNWLSLTPPILDISRSLFESDSSDILNYNVLKALKWPDITAREAMDYLSNTTLTDEQKIKRDKTLSWLEDANHHLILRESKLYPKALKEIHVAPAFLYVEGEQKTLMLPKIGIVGARKCTHYGRDATFQFAEQLSSRGVCVVSGGALGVDTAAHQGALHNKTTPTIAVMGTGLQHRYPNQNSRLFEDILEQGGALISECPLTTSPKPHLFPPRNRIISGLSMGVLVAEASLKSGSLITASYAVQQNREVFAFPGRLSDLQSEGCHQLLRQGATLVRNVDEILEECSAALDASKVFSEGSSSEMVKGKSISALPDTLSNEAKSVAVLLEKEVTPLDFDSLIRHTEMNAGAMMQVLMELELSECVMNREGLYYRS